MASDTPLHHTLSRTSQRLIRATAPGLLAALTALPAVAFGKAELGDALARRWATAQPGDFIPVLVQMSDRVNLDRDLPQLARGQMRLETRHSLVMDALQQRALRSQAGLRARLNSAAAQGQARNVRHFWIDNMVGMEIIPELLSSLSERDDVGRIALLPEVETPRVEMAPVQAQAAAREPGLDAIGAPAMWALGYTGRGRLVCGIDTGVRGSHFALADRWRGLRVPWQHAWYDARGVTTFPQDIGTNPTNHGSHTMGTMCGADPLRGDTVGVAPGAEWIAAFGIGSDELTTLDLIASLEWATDPDGNLNTTHDVPDVINNSWRFSSIGILYPCNDILDGVISNMEAAGIVVCWSAGNEGPGDSSIGYPANSANAYSTNFSVGNFDVDGDAIWFSSSRGPTPCAGDDIKPEVVAPGAFIRSAYRGNDSLYGTLTGTSMAAPHVAGAVAILRQMAPQATPAQIKQALMLSATDKGAPGEDNDFGYGLIDIPAAADSLSALMGGPDLRVDEETVGVISVGAAASPLRDSLAAGDTVSLTFRLANRSVAAGTGVYLQLAESDPYVTLIIDSVDVGIVPGEDTLTAFPLRFVVDPSTPLGQPLELILEIVAVGFASSHTLQYFTHPAPKPAQFTLDNTLVEFTVSNYGLYGLADASYYPLGGAGYLHGPSTTNHLAEGALMLGTSAAQVSDAARRSGGAGSGYQVTDHDFVPSPGGAIEVVAPVGGAFLTTRSIYDDSAAENPIGVRVTERALIFPRGDDEGYAMLIYTLENISAGAIFNLHVGMLHDWDFPQFFVTSDSSGYEATQRIGYMFDATRAALGPYRGVAVLSDPGVTAYRAINPQGYLYVSATGEVIATDALKWDLLSGGIGPPTVPTGTYRDGSSFIGTGPFDLPAPGDTVQVAFAFVGSEDGLDRLLLNAEAAKTRYDIIANSTSVGDNPFIPEGFALHQNFPNPFNPETEIRFQTSVPGVISLTVYNLLGARVRTLLDQTYPAGAHSVTWDGTDERGRAVGSGVYFYRLDSHLGSATRKMLLLR